MSRRQLAHVQAVGPILWAKDQVLREQTQMTSADEAQKGHCGVPSYLRDPGGDERAIKDPEYNNSNA